MLGLVSRAPAFHWFVSVLRAHAAHWVSTLFLLWLGLIFWGVGSINPGEWGTIVYGLIVAAFIICIPEYADIYSDRIEDRVHRPFNPLVTGELKVVTARRILIAENIIGVFLVIGLFWLTRSYPLILALVAGWVAGLIYSLPPLRLKGRKLIGPFEFGLCCALIPLVGYLLVEPIDAFVGAFALILFVGGSGVGITTKLRRTAEGLKAGLVSGSNECKLKTIDFGLDVRYSLILEVALVLGAICLIVVFGFLGIFDKVLVLYLIAFTLPPVAVGFALRARKPVSDLKNAQRAFMLICSSLAAISIATFISAIVHLS